jgi:hypothetical protein
VTGYGPPDDPSEAPTGYYDYRDDDGHDPKHPSPWYRNPIVLVALGLFAAILLGLALYFLADQTHGSGGPTQTPTSPTAATTTTTTTVAPTTAEPIAPAPTATTTVPPNTTEPTTTAPTTTPPTSTGSDDGRHHHHHHDGGTP